MNKVGLQDIVGGQLQEKFNRAFVESGGESAGSKHFFQGKTWH